MINTGLVSVTFRQLSPEEIVKLLEKAGLDAVEWGGDIHVPHGDFGRAEEVRKISSAGGIKIAAYGSYYRAGCHDEKVGSFEGVLKTAVSLEAPTIRIWAGNKGSGEADEEWWKRVIEDSSAAAELAAKEGITVSFEFHRNTLTDNAKAAKRLIEGIGHPNIRSYWQPPIGESVEERIAGLDTVEPWLSNIHAYYWNDVERRPLSEGCEEWKLYLEKAARISGQHYILMEFVKNDSPEQFLEDAAVLKKWVEEYRKV